MSSQTNDALWGEGQIPFETVVETISEGILIVTLEGDIVYVNEAMADMIGYRPDEMVGCHLFEFMSDTWARRARQNLERRRDGVAEQFDHQFEHKEGHPVWTLVSAKPMADPEGRRVGSLVAIQDISERKRMERELIEARDLLEERVEQRTEQLVEANERLTAEIEVRREAEEQALEASRAKSTFLANMSHELRTPLNAVIGYTELVQEELQTGGELSVGALIGDLDKVHRAAKHLLSLINDVLDLSKVEAGKMDVHFETIDPGQLVEEVLVTLEPLIEQGNNTVEFSDAYGGTIATDRTKLKQVLVNLVGNAAKFTEEGQIEVSLVEATVAEGNGVRLDVSDTGVGMPEDELERLFEPFTQADESTTRQYGGTGLGLTICRRFCDMLGGEIEAESIEGEGTTFSVYLPQEQPEATLSDSESLDSSLTLPSASKEQNVDPNDVDGPTVLVIDDDDSVHD
ncbi:MAG: PAS domain-containing sensor histidine kinase, partial [Persicimonas sp.]